MPLVQRETVRFVKAGIFAVTLLVAAWTRTEAAVITASSVAQADVAAAVSKAKDGDTVKIPAGTATWNSGIAIKEKAITIEGAGSDKTIITDEIVSRSTPVVSVTFTKLTGMFRLTGIQFKGGTINTGMNIRGIVQLLGSNLESGNSKWRIDRCFFNRQFGRPLYIYAWSGLIDNCTFDQNGSPGIAFDGRIPDSNNKGHRSWATPVRWGTVDSGVYVEKCNIKNSVVRAITDGFAGARFVFRNNICTNVAAENHGTESAGIFRGTRSMEIYDNTFTATQSGEYAVHFRSGTGVVFNNSVSGQYPGLSRMANYRSEDYFAPYGQANGLNVWDKNDPVVYETGTHTGASNVEVLTDSTKNWTTNQWIGSHVINTTLNKAGKITSSTGNTITCWNASYSSGQIKWNPGDRFEIRRVIKALDQPGAGMSDLLVGGSNTPSVPPTPVGWPNQADEPIYYWNNSGKTNVASSDYYIKAGRDYKNEAKPGYTPLVYPHPWAAPNQVAGVRVTSGQ